MNRVSFRPVFLEQPDEAGADVEKFDCIEAQLRDLIKIRNPGQRLSSNETDELIHTLLDGRALDEYGVWVHYPWSRRVVHLLPEAEFAELRTNRNRYKITPAEQEELGRKRIGIVGLSVGQSVALTLALERGFGELRLADFDHLDLSNLNRLRAGVHHLGVPKVYITAREIAEIDPFLKVKCFPEGLQGETYDHFLMEDGKLDLLIEECDSLDVKVLVRREARRHGIPVLMDTSDRGLLDVERFDLEPSRAIFHGLIGDPDPALLAGLTSEQKIPMVLKILGEDSLSTRMRASMIEVEASIGTWPQLASAVTLGGALAADVSRRILLDHCRVSGRFYVDLNELIPDVTPMTEPPVSEPPRSLGVDELVARASQVAAPSAPVPLGTVKQMVADGITAPSGGNCQPWKWLWDGRLHLFHDHARSHSLADFQSLGAHVALGAAWENVRISANHLGWSVKEALFQAPGLVVTFAFEPGSSDPADEDSYRLLGLRHTNRRMEGRNALPPDALARLATAAASAGAQVQWLTAPEELDAAGEIVGTGDRILFLHQGLHRHLMGELRFSKAEEARTGDGISVASLELSSSDQAGLRISRSWPALSIVKSVSGGRNLEKVFRKAIGSASALGLLTMPTYTAADFLQGGRAVQRLWLAATRLGIAVHPMTTVPYMLARFTLGGGEGLDEVTCAELSRLLPAYRRLFPSQAAHVLLFRLAITGPPTERALRRPLDACFFTAPMH